MNIKETNKKIYDVCKNFLEEIKPENIDVEKYFHGVNSGYKSLEEVFYRFSASTRNYQMMPKVIGYETDEFKKAKIDEILFNYDYKKVLEKYTPENLYQKFRETFNITSKDTTKNSWYKWSCSIIDSAQFINQFKDVKSFKEFVNCCMLNHYTKAALPLFIVEEIRGMGFALACDTIKELGYTQYCKPDVHLKEVLSSFDGISYEKKPYQLFKRVIEIATDADVTPYKLDKIIWLISSGDFYMDKIKIKGKKQELINRLLEIKKNK